MKKLRNRFTESIFKVLVISLLTIISAHIILAAPRNIILIIISLSINIFLIYYLYFFSRLKQSAFSILMVLFIGSHFTIFLNGAGGMFNLIASAFLPLYLIRKPIDINIKRDNTVRALIFTLIFCNLLGYVIGDLDGQFIGLGLLSFTGILFLFFLANNIELNTERVKIFIYITALMALLNLFVTTNTIIKIIDIRSPLFISLYENDNIFAIANTGTLDTIEIFGEWSMLSSFILLPFIFNRFTLQSFNFKGRSLIIIGFISSILCALLSFSKSVFLLTIAGLILNFILTTIYFKNYRNILKVIIVSPMVLLLIPLFIDFFQFDAIFERISENPDYLANFLNNPLTAEGTSREKVFEEGFKRLSERDWIFGNGWSNPEGNYYTWFGSYQQLQFRDFHSLYLSLIPIFGYSGSIAFFGLYIVAIYRLFNIIIKYRKSNSVFVYLATGLIFLIIFFLIDQYKVTATRNSYFSIAIIWLGLSLNLSHNFKKLENDSQIRNRQTNT